jgi:CubicO group peptidase (beta-lactamase class C family)
MRRLHCLLLVATIGASALAGEVTARTPAASLWAAGPPESQGFDSGLLAALLERVRERHLPLHKLLLIRRGHVILDAAFYPDARDRPHDVASVTKSLTSLLIGIAIDKGYIESARQPVVELLPGLVRGPVEPRRAALTVGHLLTMTSGLDCGFEPGERELAAMRRDDDWAAFALSLPMRATPGSTYAYCSCNHHLLSAILSARTKSNALTFARTHLFGPLGISEVAWPSDGQGRSHGWGDLHLAPRDLAKIGELFRLGGVWQGRRIVSEAWIRESISARVRVRDGVAYGYSWWINTTRQPHIYEAVGRGGQRVAVVPDKELVVVFNGGGVNTDDIAGDLLSAQRSDRPLPESADGQARLARALIAAAEPPAFQPAAPLPPLARSISGRRYVAQVNPLQLRTLSLTFADDHAQATVEMLGREWRVPVGLNGRPIVSSPTPTGSPAAVAGHWASQRDFVLDLDTVAEVNHFVLRLVFDGDDLRIIADEVTGEVKGLTIQARRQK